MTTVRVREAMNELNEGYVVKCFANGEPCDVAAFADVVFETREEAADAAREWVSAMHELNVCATCEIARSVS